MAASKKLQQTDRFMHANQLYNTIILQIITQIVVCYCTYENGLGNG